MKLTRRLTVVRERAPAKINLSLRVLGTRPDGFHDIEALTVSALDIYDEIRISPHPQRISLSVSPAHSAPGDATNLALRAANALAPSLPAEARTFRLALTKRIPAGAGLGGGSSDAAAVLRGLGHHFGVARSQLGRLAARLGSDVSFCLEGAPAWMRGRGERIERVAGERPGLHLVVATPTFECATPAVYRMWDEMGGPRAERSLAVPPGYEGLLDAMVNDLEPAALRVEPRLEAFREALESALERPALLCGSGSSYVAWFDTADAALAAHQRAQGRIEHRLLAVSRA